MDLWIPQNTYFVQITKFFRAFFSKSNFHQSVMLWYPQWNCHMKKAMSYLQTFSTKPKLSKNLFKKWKNMFIRSQLQTKSWLNHFNTMWLIKVEFHKFKGLFPDFRIIFLLDILRKNLKSKILSFSASAFIASFAQ